MEKQYFTSEKVYDGYSACFRQWKAEGTHCKFLHGYAISFKVTFSGELDERNWVQDFGAMKRSNVLIEGMSPKQWMDHMFDHTTIVAQDDPYLQHFEELDKEGVIQLRILPAVGCEKFAQYVCIILQEWVHEESEGRVRVDQVTVREHEKNSATYYNSK